jgi:4-hydroxybenzoate polyprenyltransferase
VPAPVPRAPDEPASHGGRPWRRSERAAALVRLVHPFPSILDAVATGALALIAGGGPAAAGSLALSMLAIQLSIGATNDVADAARDALSRPAKPIPSGAVAIGVARSVAVVAAAIGLALAASRGPAAFVIAVTGLAVGLAYDLRLKASAYSWLPFAVGIPLVPVFAWVGAVGSIPPPVVALALLAVPAGSGLAIANALPDAEADRAAGTPTIATVLGVRRAWWAATALLAGTWLVAVLLLPVLGAGPGDVSGTGPAWAAVAGSAILIAVGAWAGRGPAAGRRRSGWGIEAIGVVTLGCGWVLALEIAGRLTSP